MMGSDARFSTDLGVKASHNEKTEKACEVRERVSERPKRVNAHELDYFSKGALAGLIHSGL